MATINCRTSFFTREIIEILLASLFLAMIFFISYQWNFLIAFGIGAFGLIMHELGHKFVGTWRCIKGVHFGLSPVGTLIGFLSAIGIGHVIAAPGGVTVDADAHPRDKILMALAGPMMNFLMFSIFVLLHLFHPVTYETTVGVQGDTIMLDLWLSIAFMNLFLGAFNLVPFPMFDGMYIYDYSKGVWVVTATFVAVVVFVSWGAATSALVPLFRGTWGGVVSMIGPKDFATFMVPVVPGLMIAHRLEMDIPGYIARVTADKEYEEI